MPNTNDILTQLLAYPTTAVDVEWVKEMKRLHPTFTIPCAFLLARNPHDIDDDTRRDMQEWLMLNCADPTAFADSANLSGDNWTSLYPDPKPREQKGTIDTIDDFLNTYGSTSSKEDALIERLIFNPVVPDYLDSPQAKESLSSESLDQAEAKTQEEEAAAETSTAEILPPPFKHPKQEAGPNQNKSEAKPADSPILMESLARIFIKQRRYERAFEIISNLSLKFPEKSAYFADQLRFLQKLINNRNKKSQ